ncbi:MAG: glycosyltransferase family 1 protein [Merismopedia sp. SIO2A8]|nr:glycosyltransferase family 1 protein [Merismopedia sp. SIO2A8]
MWHPFAVPHWKQPGIIPRDTHRGTRVENIAFVGTRTNLAPELKSEKWSQALANLGCHWVPIFDPKKWNDYRHLDAIIAVRGFDNNPHPHKPASKLVNCWSAGVPAILAPESAFMAVRQSDRDFMVIRSIDDAIQAVKTLKQNPDLYSSMVENGQTRAQEFSDEKVTEYWVHFFQDHVFPQYPQWLNVPESVRLFQFSKRYATLKINRMRNRIGKNRGIKHQGPHNQRISQQFSS